MGMNILEKVKNEVMVTNGVLDRVGKGILDAVFPVVCVGCGREGQYICARCENFANAAAPVCPVCQCSSFSGERHEDCVRQ